MSTIYNPSKYSKKGAYLTKSEADQYYRKLSANLLVTSNETVGGDETVVGDSTVGGDLSVQGSSTFYQVPMLNGNLTNQIINNAHLVNKQYVDTRLSTVENPLYPNKFLVSQNSSYVSSGSTFIMTTPKIVANGWDVFLNFPVQEDGRTFFAQNATINLTWSFTQSKGLSNTGYTSNGNGTYTFPSTPSNAGLISNYTVNLSTSGTGIRYGREAVTATYILSTMQDKMTVLAPVATKTLFNPTKIDITKTPSVFTDCSLATYTPTNTYYSQVTNKYNVAYNCYPLNFSYVNKNKIWINIKFPQLCKTTANVVAPHNDPTYDGWVSSCNCSIDIVESPFAVSNTNLSSTLGGTNSGLNNSSGGAYFSMT